MTKNFHREPVEQRLNQLSKLDPGINMESLTSGGLSLKLADHMIENCIGVMPLPLGLGLGFKVNGKSYLVPMAIEETSVIAACSTVAKLIAEKGSGFMCLSSPQIMIG
jgi:degradative hydroxymethylglutaryl-CoA reductase